MADWARASSATIILAPGSVNDLTHGANTAWFGIGMTVDDWDNDYETDYFLTIEGSGKLTASGGVNCPGIGGISAVIISLVGT